MLHEIVYEEYLPLLLGHDMSRIKHEKFSLPADQADDGVNNLFSTAAFRLHLTSTTRIERVAANGKRMAPLEMNETTGWFMTAAELQNKYGGVDHIVLRSLISAATPGSAHEMDTQLRNRLFGKKLDLLALNIQRGRDHGLPNYRDVRQAFGLSQSGTKYIENLQLVQEIYGGTNEDMDVYAGMLLETPRPVVGETAASIIVEQFQRLKRVRAQTRSKLGHVESEERRAFRVVGTMSKLLERNLEGFSDIRKCIIPLIVKELNVMPSTADGKMSAISC